MIKRWQLGKAKIELPRGGDCNLLRLALPPGQHDLQGKADGSLVLLGTFNKHEKEGLRGAVKQRSVFRLYYKMHS